MDTPKSSADILQQMEDEHARLIAMTEAHTAEFPLSANADPVLETIWEEGKDRIREIENLLPQLQRQADLERKEDQEWAENKLKQEAERHDILGNAAAFRIQEILCQDREQEVVRAAHEKFMEHEKADGEENWRRNLLDAYRDENRETQARNTPITSSDTLHLGTDKAWALIALIRQGKLSLQPSGKFTEDELATIMSPNRSDKGEYRFDNDTQHIFLGWTLMVLADELEQNPSAAALPQSEVAFCLQYIATKQGGTLDQIRQAYRDNAVLSGEGLSVEQAAQTTQSQDPSSGHFFTLNGERIPGNIILHATDGAKPLLWQAIEQFNTKYPLSAVDKIIPAKSVARPDETASEDEYILHISDGNSKKLLQFISEKFPNSASETGTSSVPHRASAEPPDLPRRG